MRTACVVGAILSILFAPAFAAAQNTGIGGVVRDSSGALLPGVTVEAASPVLIEKVRTATSDSQGLYQIVDLRPGRYTVTFTLPGFNTVVREGVELTGAFTATVNAEMRVGAIEETVTVSGAAPTVDVRNVVAQKVMSDALRENLPTARNVHNMAQLLPGVLMASGTLRPSAQDVGGLSGDRGVAMIHGSRRADYILTLDGSMMNYGASPSQAQAFNPAEGQEYVYELGALPAESQTGGVWANVIPKEGGNRFSAFFLGSYAGESFQSDNLDADLRAQNLNSVNRLKYIYDVNAAFGGPLKTDRLWFFSSVRRWAQQETVAGAFRPIDPLSFVYNPALGAAGNVDLSQPNIYSHWNTHVSTRLTWQVNQKHKVAFYVNTQPRVQNGYFVSGTRVFEAGIRQTLPLANNHLFQASWKAPLTSRLLLEAGFLDATNHIVFLPTVDGADQRVSVTDVGTGITFRSAPGAGYTDCFCYRQPNVKVSASYITGSHAAKVGMYLEQGKSDTRGSRAPQGMSFTLRNGAPTSVTIYNQPTNAVEKYRILSLFGQDQWTLKRLTVNAGVRFDTFVGWVPDDQTSGPGPFSPFRVWTDAARNDLPNWKDVLPRFGVAYDLFGNGKTALKATVSRYVLLGQNFFTSANNPLRFNASSARSWNDTPGVATPGTGVIGNGNFVPDCDLAAIAANGECGALLNPAFGTPAGTSRPDEELRTGWGKRPYNWEMSVGVHHELVEGVSVDATYFRRSYGNFTVTDNLNLSPSDYTEYCITGPSDGRLPNGGGDRICGLYDVNRVVRPDNLVTFASNYGEQTDTFNGIDASVNARLPYQITLSGGLSSGTGTTDNFDSINSRSACFVVDSPQGNATVTTATVGYAPGNYLCDIDYPWLTSVRFLAAVGLPWDMDAGFTFLNNPGPQITAAYTVVNSQVQFVNSSRTTLTAGSATIPLVQPGTMFGERHSQVDVRVGKTIRSGRVRIRALLDVANLFNSNSVLVLNTTYGANWLRPSYVLPGRLIKPTVQIDF